MSETYYIVSLSRRNTDSVLAPWAWEAGMWSDTENMIRHLKHLQKGEAAGTVRNITIRKFDPVTGRTVMVEPYLRGWDVAFRESQTPEDDEDKSPPPSIMTEQFNF